MKMRIIRSSEWLHSFPFYFWRKVLNSCLSPQYYCTSLNGMGDYWSYEDVTGYLKDDNKGHTHTWKESLKSNLLPIIQCVWSTTRRIIEPLLMNGWQGWGLWQQLHPNTIHKNGKCFSLPPLKGWWMKVKLAIFTGSVFYYRHYMMTIYLCGTV